MRLKIGVESRKTKVGRDEAEIGLRGDFDYRIDVDVLVGDGLIDGLA